MKSITIMLGVMIFFFCMETRDSGIGESYFFLLVIFLMLLSNYRHFGRYARIRQMGWDISFKEFAFSSTEDWQAIAEAKVIIREEDYLTLPEAEPHDSDLKALVDCVKMTKDVTREKAKRGRGG